LSVFLRRQVLHGDFLIVVSIIHSLHLNRAFPLLFLLSAPPVLLPWRGTHTSRPRPRPANPCSSSSRSWSCFYLILRSIHLRSLIRFIHLLLIHPTSSLKSRHSSGKSFI
jgi:hypothetical protein